MGVQLYKDGQRKFLMPDERQRFIEAARTRPNLLGREFCLTLAFTGARLSEVCKLRKSQLDLRSRQITFEAPGNLEADGGRAVPIPDDLAHMLERLAPQIRGGRIWPRCSRETGWRWVKDVMEAAGISGPAANPLGLRHGFAIAALKQGHRLEFVQRWMGHPRISTTAQYAEAAYEGRAGQPAWVA